MNRKLYFLRISVVKLFMKEDIVILGAGGFSKEILWLLEEQNLDHDRWNIVGFVDNGDKESLVDGYPIVGSDEWLLHYPYPINAVCGFGSPALKKRVVAKYAGCDSHVTFPNIMSPTARISKRVAMGTVVLFVAEAL